MHWQDSWMETASKQLGNTDLENKERDVGIVQTAKIMKSWEWVWEWTEREEKRQRTSATETLASNKGWEEEGKQAKTDSALQ